VNLLQDALQYAKAGYSIVPVTPGEKAPPLVDWQAYQDAPANATQIREWWSKTPTANIAIVTGRISGLTVIDFDGDKGRESFRTSLDNQLPSTRIHRTPRGAHMLFQYCEDLKQTTAILPGVDIRNDGGYIIAPPSIVKGKAYEVLREREIVAITTLPPSLNGQKPASKDSATEIGDAPK
jgi:putative DNA primase/helicase